MKLLHHPNIVRIHEVYIPAGKILNCSCSFVAFLNIAGNCRQMGPMEPQLWLQTSKNLDVVTEIVMVDHFLKPCLLVLELWWSLNVHNPFVNTLFPMNFLKQVIGTKTKIYIVMEYVSGGQLFDKIVRINNLSKLNHYVIIYFSSIFNCNTWCAVLWREVECMWGKKTIPATYWCPEILP